MALATPLFLFAYWLNSAAAGLTPSLLGGADAGRLGLTGPFTLLLICLTLYDHSEAVTPAPRWTTLGFALLTLVPSSMVATLGMAGVALSLAVQGRGPVRFAAACLVALALTTLWSGVGRALLAEPLLALDAIAVEALLAWAGQTPTRSGNIIRLGDGHAIIIFADCATAFLLFPALTLSAALGSRDATRLTRRFAFALASLCLALIAANLLRLCLLAISAEAYAIGHGPLGQNLFDALLIGLAAAAAALGRDKPTPRPPSPIVQASAGRWLTVALAIALVGFGLKLLRYGAPHPPADAHARETLVAFLDARGWRFDGDQELIQSTGYSVTRFRQEGCDQSFSASLISAEGESLGAVRQALPNAGFFYGGAPLKEPSRIAAVLLWIDGAASAIGLREGFPMPALALAPPPTEATGPCLPPPISAWVGLRRRL